VERPVRDKHAGLLQSFVNCGLKKFYNMGSWRRFEPALPNEKTNIFRVCREAEVGQCPFFNEELI
jgi:hypothetical protein